MYIGNCIGIVSFEDFTFVLLSFALWVLGPEWPDAGLCSMASESKAKSTNPKGTNGNSLCPMMEAGNLAT